MELVKATRKWVLYVGLILIGIGLLSFFKLIKFLPPLLGGLLMFIGFMFFITWFSNREDKMCPTDINDERDCVPVKK